MLRQLNGYQDVVEASIYARGRTTEMSDAELAHVLQSSVPVPGRVWRSGELDVGIPGLSIRQLQSTIEGMAQQSGGNFMAHTIDGHWVVVVGATSRHVNILNPRHTTPTQVPLRTFRQLWSGGVVFNRAR